MKELKISQEELDQILALCATADPILMNLYRVYRRELKTFRALALLRLEFHDESKLNEAAQFVALASNIRSQGWSKPSAVQTTAWVLKNNPSPLQLSDRFALNERYLVKYLNAFLAKKGNPFEQAKEEDNKKEDNGTKPV